MMIKIDSNNIIISWCTVGGIEGGISVDNIPDEVQNAPLGYYKYIDGAFVVNADYTEPPAGPALTTEERLIQIDNTITDLQKMYFEILMGV